MTGSVIVTDARKTDKNRFSLPVSAIASNPDGSAFVWVVSKPDNKLVKLKVTTGEASGGNIAILSGLKPGDVIATAGIFRLQANMVVRPISRVGD